MEEQAIAPMEGQPPKSNRAWFRPGDERINREGRPKGSRISAKPDPSTWLATSTDRVQTLFVQMSFQRCWMKRFSGPRVANLPPDFQIVGSRFDNARNGVVYLIRSQSFPRIARGAPVPQFNAHFDGVASARGA
jgi:hypothetical protein